MELIIRLLAVVGGAAIGAVAIGFVVRLFGRFLGAKTVPRRPLLMLRGLAGAVTGYVAWLVVFGTGGGGIGGPGGFDRGGGDGPTQTDTPSTARVASATLTPERNPSISVAMLGGKRVANERYYLVLGEMNPRNMAELKEYLRQQQKQGTGEIDILIYENSVAEDHAAVALLREWARQSGMKVKVSLSSGEVP